MSTVTKNPSGNGRAASDEESCWLPDFESRDELLNFVREVGINEFLSRHKTLVHNMVKRLYRPAFETSCGLLPEDFQNEALFQIAQLLEIWDRSKSQWRTYVMNIVRLRLYDFLREHSPTSRVTVQRLNILRTAENSLFFDLGRPPTEEEIAARAGMTTQEAAQIRHDHRTANPISVAREGQTRSEDLDDTSFREGSWNVLKTFWYQEDPEQVHLLFDRIVEMLRRVGQHWDRVAFFSYFFLGLTMKEVGMLIRASESRVSQAISGMKRQLMRTDSVPPTPDGCDIDPFQMEMQQVWDALPEQHKLRVVSELNLPTFALAPSKEEKDKARRYEIRLPNRVARGPIRVAVSGSGVMSLLIGEVQSS